MAAKVPDLGSDFAQKLLKDLRRRRERLGFESAAAQRGTANVAPRDAYSNSQKPLQIRNTQQHATPRSGRAESPTNRLYRQGNTTPVAGARKPRSHGAAPTAQSHTIVPFQGGGGSKPKPAANVDVDMQMALALALSNRGKLQNIHLVESHGGRTKNYLLSPSAHVGKVAIGVQKLNDILMAYTSAGAGSGGARGFGKRGASVEVGKQLLRGAMDLEESLNMLMMLQDASDYMGMGMGGGGSSGNGKVLLLEGKESHRRSSSSSRSSTSARLVEIVDDEEGSEADAKASSADASLQIVPVRKSSQSGSHRSGLQLTTSSKSSGVSGDDSQARMPNLIAKLMGLENLPSGKVVVEHNKATERFVRPDAVPRKPAAKNAATFSTLPIRIVGSEGGVPSAGQQLRNFLSGEWNIRLANTSKSEESGRATSLSNGSSHLASDKRTRQAMIQGLKENAERRVVSVTQQAAVDENVVRQGVKLTGESKLQKTVGVGCRTDSRKMNFLQRFVRKSGKSKPVTEEKKDVVQGSSKKVPATGVKQPSTDGEVRSRRASRAKFNKENLVSSAENKPDARNGKADQLRSKQANKKKVVEEKRLIQSHRQIQNDAESQIPEHKRSLKSEATRTREKMEYATLVQLKNGEFTKEDDAVGRTPPSYNTPSGDAIFRRSAAEMKVVCTSEKQFSEEIKDPATAVAHTNAGSIAETIVGSVNQTASEAIQVVEMFSEGQQQQQQKRDVRDPSRKDSDDRILKPGNPADLERHEIDAVSRGSFTETQLLLKEMLLKDHYLLETAKSITRVNHIVPASATAHVDTGGRWLDKGNKLLSDTGREVLRRKGKRIKAMADASAAQCNATTLRLRTLDDLVRELDADIQSLNMRPHEQRDNNPAEHLRMVLCGDIENARADANSVWEFGWNCVRELPIEKSEVVKDLEKNILGGIITDVARELIDVSRFHDWCACEA